MKQIFIFIVIASLQGYAGQPLSVTKEPVALPVCQNQMVSPHSRHSLKDGLEAIPEGLLVARDAQFSIEARSKEGPMATVRAYQSFLNLHRKNPPRILCGSSEAPVQNRFSMMAPTLVHMKQKGLNVFWQFQVLSENSVLSPWNTRSLALRSEEKLEKTLGLLGYSTEVFQISSSIYVVVYQQKTKDKVQTLSVTYDLI